jgi:hypothetical protein
MSLGAIVLLVGARRLGRSAQGGHVSATAHVNLSDALAMGPPPPGNLAVPVFAHGSLAVEMYQLEGPTFIDMQVRRRCRHERWSTASPAKYR